jgi:hypothetical protein
MKNPKSSASRKGRRIRNLRGLGYYAFFAPVVSLSHRSPVAIIQSPRRQSVQLDNAGELPIP